MGAEVDCRLVELRNFAQNRMPMRPILLIENLKNLHDARYCAAVGISMVSYEMDESANSDLSPMRVKEISEWLSGVEFIGKFQNENPDELNVMAAAALLDWLELPLDDDFTKAKEILPGLVFRVQSSDKASALRMLQAHAQFPEALMLIDAHHQIMLPFLQGQPDLMSRCILRHDDPNSLLVQLASQGLKPYGFSLGEFARESDGQLDYDACDVFLEAFAEMVPA